MPRARMTAIPRACITWRGTRRTGATSDALFALLGRIGATILDAPKHYPEYSEGYYAVFFADPDGMKLEYCYVP